MSSGSLIPSSFLKRARDHLRRTGQPLVYGPRRRLDTGLFAERNPASTRWFLMVNPSTVPILLEQVMDALTDEEQGPRTRMVAKLTHYATFAVEGLPKTFESEDGTVGRVEVCDGVLMVSSALAVSCLSWHLRKKQTGFYIEPTL